MKKSRFSEEQIIGILKQHESGVKTADLYTQGDGDETRTAQGAFLNAVGLQERTIQ